MAPSPRAASSSRAASAGRPDGRVARSQRTRRAIVESLLGLLDSGDLRPTAERIAERAGVSVRSIFQHFADIESLFGAVAERHVARIAESIEQIPDDGSLNERLDAFVTQRVRLYERIAGVARAARVHEPFSSSVQKTWRDLWLASRREIERVFERELMGHAATDREEILDALVVGTSWNAWDALRAESRLSRSRAERVIRRTAAALLG